eukprot:s4257_g9.t1
MAAGPPSATKRFADRPVWLKDVDVTGYSALACRARWIQLQTLRKSRGVAAVIIGSGPDVSFNGANEVALSWLLLGISGRELLASTVDTAYSECFVCIRADRTYIFCKRSVQQEVVMRTALWEAVTIIVPSEEDEADADKYEALKIGAFIDMVKSCSSLGVFVRELDTGHDLKMTVERWPLVQAFGFDDYGHGFLTLRRHVVNLEAEFQQKILAAWDLQSMLWARSLVSKLQKAWEDALLCYDSHAGKDFLAVSPLLDYFLYGRLSMTDEDVVALREGQTGAPALQLNPAPRVLFGMESDKILSGIIPTGDEPPQHFAPDPLHMIWEGVDPVTGVAATRTYLLNTPFEQGASPATSAKTRALCRAYSSKHMAMQTAPGPPHVPSGLQLRQSPVLSSRRQCVFQACGHLHPAFIAVGIGAVSSRRRVSDPRRQQTKVRAEESSSESVPTQLIPDEFFDEPQVETFQSSLMQCQALRRKVQEELAYELEDEVWESLKVRLRPEIMDALKDELEDEVRQDLRKMLSVDLGIEVDVDEDQDDPGIEDEEDAYDDDEANSANSEDRPSENRFQDSVAQWSVALPRRLPIGGVLQKCIGAPIGQHIKCHHEDLQDELEEEAQEVLMEELEDEARFELSEDLAEDLVLCAVQAAATRCCREILQSRPSDLSCTSDRDRTLRHKIEEILRSSFADVSGRPDVYCREVDGMGLPMEANQCEVRSTYIALVFVRVSILGIVPAGGNTTLGAVSYGDSIFLTRDRTTLEAATVPLLASVPSLAFWKGPSDEERSTRVKTGLETALGVGLDWGRSVALGHRKDVRVYLEPPEQPPDPLQLGEDSLDVAATCKLATGFWTGDATGNLVPACKFWLKLQLEPNQQAGTFVSGVGPQHTMSVTHEADCDLCVVHTSQPILFAENLVDFQRFMGELDRAGREEHFWKMWGAVWEVCHLPIPDEVLTHLSFGGRQVPLRRFVCVASDCRRCHQGVGGFQFPFLGPCRTLGSVAMRLEGCSQLAGPSCRRNSVCSELPASRCEDPRSARRLPLLAARRSPLEEPPVDVPWAEAVFLDPVDRSQRALAAWVLHVAASSPEVHARTAGCVLPESSDWFAVLLQSGRICGGTHGAGEWCVKRSRPREPSTPPPRRSDASFSGSSGRASYSWDDGRTERRSRASSDEASALERHFDSIASIKGKRVQPPTRLWQSREGGALWLSGMPTEESLASYPRCDIQLCWFRESLTCQGGAVIPKTLQMQIAITDPKSRDQKEAWPVIRQTLMSGGSVLGHCVAGRHRAAGGQALILSLLRPLWDVSASARSTN